MLLDLVRVVAVYTTAPGGAIEPPCRREFNPGGELQCRAGAWRPHTARCERACRGISLVDTVRLNDSGLLIGQGSGLPWGLVMVAECV